MLPQISVSGTSFKIMKIDPRATGYVSIVYSWLDPRNYESAGITLSSEGIYVNFAKVTNGKSLISTFMAWNKD